MDFAAIKDQFIDYFMEKFNHDLIDDKVDNPFVLFSIISPSAINPHRDSFGMYVIKRGNKAKHLEFSTTNMAEALLLEAKYIIQKRSSSVQPVEGERGYADGFPFSKNQIVIVTAVSNFEDASFVAKSAIHKLHSILNPPPKTTNPRT